MNISVRVYAALLPRREQYLTYIWREKPFLKFDRLQKLKRVHLNTITAIFTASSAFPQKSSFLILRHCMHRKNNSIATQQDRPAAGCCRCGNNSFDCCRYHLSDSNCNFNSRLCGCICNLCRLLSRLLCLFCISEMLSF